MKPVLVTGAAGFIGYHFCQRLLAENITVVGIDNLNDYYDVALKKARLAQLKTRSDFSFEKIDIADRNAMASLFDNHTFDSVVHLAAQPGVRYSLENPHAYVDSNLVGMINVLEGCRHQQVAHLVYASSSSVYGMNPKMPFSTEDNVDHPISLYAATKKANELMAHTYAHLYQLPCTGLRFFTVYGPWGRPDMAPFKFARAITRGKPIDVYNQGEMQRDFTYVDDIVEGIFRALKKPPEVDVSNDSSPPYKLYNIGHGKPVALMDFIRCLEDSLGKKAELNFMPMQPGDVPATWADTLALEKDTGYKPETDLEVGIPLFAKWFTHYYSNDC